MLSTALVALISLFLITEAVSNVIIPRHYSVLFVTDVGNRDGNYSGTVWIYFDAASRDVRQIEIEARNLEIDEVNLAGKELELEKQGPKDNVIVKLNDQLSEGRHQLNIAFRGFAGNGDVMSRGSYDRGFYLMSKPTKSGFVAFPNLGAELRTTFDISVVHRKNLKAWSNMPLRSPPAPYDQEGFVISNFRRTPAMYVYDVGFFVADFDSVKLGNVTVVARDKAVLQSTQYVASLGNDLVRIMDEHTAVDYTEPVPDYVYIVLPRDLPTENLTEFERLFVEEQYMVYDLREHDLDRFSKVLQRSSYKLMLQWLGNWITPDEERLHQAFSNVYTYFNAEKVYPEEFLMLLYQMDVLQGSLRYNHEKPSCVLNMFWLMVMDEKWRIVMRNLMKNRKPRTLTTAQLTSELQTLWPEDYSLPEGAKLETIFNQWMYSDDPPPVLDVYRFYWEGKVALLQNSSEKILPYNYATEYSHFNQLGPFQWLTDRFEEVQIEGSEDHWLIVNKEEFGFYRVKYDHQNWKLIADGLRRNASCMHRMNRMQLLDDAFHFAKNDQLDVTVFLELITYLTKEMFYVAWYNAYNIFTSGYYPEIEPPKLIKSFFLHLIDPYYRTFASQPISASTPQMELHIRSRIAGLACWLGEEGCLSRARSQFQQAVAKNIPVEPNWARTIYCYGLRNTTDSELEWLLNSRSDDFSQSSLEYLRCVDNKKNLRRVMKDLVKSKTPEAIVNLIRALDEKRFKMLHSLLTSKAGFFQQLDVSTVRIALESVTRETKSRKILALIDDLDEKLKLQLRFKGAGSAEKNIWQQPGATWFIKAYMKRHELITCDFGS
ncbi:aminopeptidase N [Aedes albopictus]|uniref:ERAP1-like C-terminal domain-containing protein n=1 Tax=Aedes albopictus TaxID=7160 RepID=A0ABM1ZPQ6_AEDAL|nr:glutamyl aminopeptidase-like [Aedes albopictus]